MDFNLSPRGLEMQQRLLAFFDAEILPRNREWHAHVVERGEPAPFMPARQARARKAGWWNLGLPALAADEPGTHLTNLEYAPLAEIMGRVFWASEAFNCHAPDVPNMITLQHACTPAQKERWLKPLLNGATRSAFAMTEPAVASSDATNIAFIHLLLPRGLLSFGARIFLGAGAVFCAGRHSLIRTYLHSNRTAIVPMGVIGACRHDRKLSIPLG